MREFEDALLRSIDQAQHGKVRVARRGRPVGSFNVAATKQATTIRLSPDVMQAFRASGRGWQTRMDAALRDWLRTHDVASL
jgi:uncharacterized protein (DUF4415 family)